MAIIPGSPRTGLNVSSTSAAPSPLACSGLELAGGAVAGAAIMWDQDRVVFRDGKSLQIRALASICLLFPQLLFLNSFSWSQGKQLPPGWGEIVGMCQFPSQRSHVGGGGVIGGLAMVATGAAFILRTSAVTLGSVVTKEISPFSILLFTPRRQLAPTPKARPHSTQTTGGSW